MTKTKWCLIFPVACAACALQAGEVAAPIVAKIIRIIVVSSGTGKVTCLDPEISAELNNLGIGQDPEAKVVWAVADSDIAKFAKQGRLVICGQVGQIAAGAAIAIVAEGGRPAVYVSPANALASKVTIPDAVLKIGKVVK